MFHEESKQAEYRELFKKLGLNYDYDVPKRIKDQLAADKNAKQILINLCKKFEDGEFASLLNVQNIQ